MREKKAISETAGYNKNVCISIENPYIFLGEKGPKKDLMIHKIPKGGICSRTLKIDDEDILFQSSVMEVYKKDDKVQGHP